MWFKKKAQDHGKLKPLPDLAKDRLQEAEPIKEQFLHAPEDPQQQKPISEPKSLPSAASLPKLEPKKQESVEQHVVKEPAPVREPEPLAVAEKQPVADTIVDDAGFFAEFEQFLSEKDLKQEGATLLDELLEKDLLSKMKQFHVHRKEGKPFFFHTDELSAQLAEKLRNLKGLERDWWMRHNELVKLEEGLMQKEAEIDIRTDELKHLLKEIKLKSQFDKSLKPEEYFYLSNGQVLKSIRDLKQHLKTMPVDVFTHHVKEDKNDFATWILHVFKNEVLAQQLTGTTSRDSMLHILHDL